MAKTPSFYRPQMLADLRAMPPNVRAAAIAALRLLERYPEPDGFSRREAPSPPFKPGTLVASIAGFVIRYVITERGIEFIRVQVPPDI